MEKVREGGVLGGGLTTMKTEGITVQSQEWQCRFRATTLVTKINPIILWRKGTAWHLWWCLLWNQWHWNNWHISGRALGYEGTSGIICSKALVKHLLQTTPSCCCWLKIDSGGIHNKTSALPVAFTSDNAVIAPLHHNKCSSLHSPHLNITELTVEQMCQHGLLRLIWDDFWLSIQLTWQWLKAVRPESLFHASWCLDMEFQHWIN